jgi:hypothetical protein
MSKISEMNESLNELNAWSDKFYNDHGIMNPFDNSFNRLVQSLSLIETSIDSSIGDPKARVGSKCKKTKVKDTWDYKNDRTKLYQMCGGEHKSFLEDKNGKFSQWIFEKRNSEENLRQFEQCQSFLLSIHRRTRIIFAAFFNTDDSVTSLKELVRNGHIYPSYGHSTYVFIEDALNISGARFVRYEDEDKQKNPIELTKKEARIFLKIKEKIIAAPSALNQFIVST